MESSLSVLRNQIIYMFFNGPLPDDSKLTHDFFNRVVIDARAEAIQMTYMQTRSHVDEELFTEVPLTVLSNSTGLYASIPKAITLENRKHIRIRGTNENQNSISYYEIISARRMETIKNNVFDNKKPKACVVGNRVKFLSKNILKNVVAEMIVYNPIELAGFNEDAKFPVSGGLVNLMKEIIRKRDLNYYAQGRSDNENNSLPSFQKQAPAENSQQ
jgi:hypothetical protein